jgi:hypothetical protein
MLRKTFKVECTLWGEDFVGVLPQLSEWLTKCRIVPHAGDTVPLPSAVRAARSKPTETNGHDAEIVRQQVSENTGVVTSVYYLPTRDMVKVGIKESRRANGR